MRPFRRLFGFRPAGFADHAAKLDFTELDRIVPHPVYARRGWISVLTRGPRASAQELELIGHAYRRAAIGTAEPACPALTQRDGTWPEGTADSAPSTADMQAADSVISYARGRS